MTGRASDLATERHSGGLLWDQVNREQQTENRCCISLHDSRFTVHCISQQHPELPLPDFAGPHSESDISWTVMSQHEELRPRALWMTAWAQPTPACTVIASSGQLREQALHSMHASRSVILAKPLSMAKTPWGQTTAHIPHPVHFSSKSSRVATPLKYLVLRIMSLPLRL
jgi:hypothetical protein